MNLKYLQVAKQVSKLLGSNNNIHTCLVSVKRSDWPFFPRLCMTEWPVKSFYVSQAAAEFNGCRIDWRSREKESQKTDRVVVYECVCLHRDLVDDGDDGLIKWRLSGGSFHSRYHQRCVIHIKFHLLSQMHFEWEYTFITPVHLPFLLLTFYFLLVTRITFSSSRYSIQL